MALELSEQGKVQLESLHGRLPPPGLVADGVLYRCRLGFALERVGDREGAARAFHEALELDPRWQEKFAAEARRLAGSAAAPRREPPLTCELAGQAVRSACAALANVLSMSR